ncbi:MAG TPA: hypothetical protein VGV68_13030 [Terriglobia bacterium]|nr:hypothetical protein [Terriglobia bacterium]
MKKNLVLISFTLLAGLISGAAHARPVRGLREISLLPQTHAWAASPQAAAAGEKKPAWKTTEEYNAYQAAFNEKDPHKKISLAEAFLAKFQDTDFKDLAYLQELAAYQQLGDGPNAIGAGEKALAVNPDNLDALRYVSFAFPFVFKATDPDAASKLTRAENESKHGLDLLQKLQKPANATDEQFNQAIKGLRSIFNGTVGFVALQQKDYAGAITSLKTAAEDNPGNNLTFSMLGQAYLQSSPPDYDNGIWSLARSVALAKASSDPNAAALAKYYDQVYVSRHGSDEGEGDIINQASASVNPPAGFKVAPAEKHKPTGNAAIDAFYNMEDSLKVGGDQEKQAWAQVKGQPFAMPGTVNSSQKGTDPDTYLVQIAITDESKAKDGYDIVLRDKQPDAKYLSKGDPVAFQGTLAEYTMTPVFSLTLDGTIDDKFLEAAKDKAETKTKPKPRPRSTARRRKH